MTSNPYGDVNAVALPRGSLREGELRVASYARPGKLFTAHETLIVGQVGVLRAEVLGEIRNVVIHLLQQG